MTDQKTSLLLSTVPVPMLYLRVVKHYVMLQNDNTSPPLAYTNVVFDRVEGAVGHHQTVVSGHECPLPRHAHLW